MRVFTVGSSLLLDFNYKLMNLLYSITFSPASTFCAVNFFENRSSPSTLLIEENTTSAIHLLPASLICLHLRYPSFLITSTSCLLNWHPLAPVDALFLIAITGWTFNLSSKLKFLLLSCALSAYTLSILYFLDDSLTRGQNFLASCTFPLVIRKDTTFLDFASAAICNLVCVLLVEGSINLRYWNLVILVLCGILRLSV